MPIAERQNEVLKREAKTRFEIGTDRFRLESAHDLLSSPDSFVPFDSLSALLYLDGTSSPHHCRLSMVRCYHPIRVYTCFHD
jgi:hypothetical protein